MDGGQPEEEEEVQDHSPALVDCWWVADGSACWPLHSMLFSLVLTYAFRCPRLQTEVLDATLRTESAGPGFAQLPFNYMEISRILLEA